MVLSGKPFSLYEIEKDKLDKSSIVFIPLKGNDKFVAMMKMNSVNNELHVVDCGTNELAKEIQYEKNKFSNLNFEGLLRLYATSSDLLILYSGEIF